MPCSPFNKSVIIIPTYNEKENIEKMISALLGNYQNLSILIIDDGSPDGTAKIVKKLQETHSTLHLIERGKKLGLGTAYITGFRWAIQNGFEFIFEMDCDFSHSPDDIPRLLEAAQTADMVIRSNIDGISIVNWPMKRLLLSYCASIYTRFFTGIPGKRYNWWI